MPVPGLRDVLEPIREAARAAFSFSLPDILPPAPGRTASIADRVHWYMATHFFETVYVDRSELRALRGLLRHRDPIALTGERGAGKTTLIRGYQASQASARPSLDQVFDPTASTRSVLVLDLLHLEVPLRRSAGATIEEQVARQLLDLLTAEFVEGPDPEFSQAHSRLRRFDTWLLTFSDVFRDVRQKLVSYRKPPTRAPEHWLDLLEAAEDSGDWAPAKSRYLNTTPFLAQVHDLMSFLVSACHHSLILFVDNTDHMYGDAQAEVVKAIHDLYTNASIGNGLRFVITIRAENVPLLRAKLARTSPHFEFLPISGPPVRRGAINLGSPTLSVIGRYIDRRLKVLLAPELGLVQEVARQRNCRGVLRQLDVESPEALVANHMNLMEDVITHAYTGPFRGYMRDWFNYSLRHIGRFLVDLSDQLVDELVEWSYQPSRTGILAHKRVMRSLYFNLFSTLGYPNLVPAARDSDVPEPLRLLSKPGTPGGELRVHFSRMRVLEYLHKRQPDERIPLDELIEDLNLVGCSPGRTKLAVRSLAEQRHEDDTGLIRLDPPPQRSGTESGTSVIILPAGCFLIDRLSCSIEFLYLSALATDKADLRRIAPTWAGWDLRDTTLPRYARDPLFPARLAVAYFCDYVMPHHRAQFPYCFKGADITLTKLGAPQRLHLHRYRHLFVRDDDYPLRVKQHCSSHLQRLQAEFRASSGELRALEASLTAAVTPIRVLWDNEPKMH